MGYNTDSKFLKLSGYELKASKDISQHFYISGDHTDISRLGLSLNTTTLGIGYKYNYSSNSTFYTEIDYLYTKPDYTRHINGHEATIGVRSMINPKFELNTSIEHINFRQHYNHPILSNSTSLILGSVYKLSDKFSIYASSKSVDKKSYTIGLRINF